MSRRIIATSFLSGAAVTAALSVSLAAGPAAPEPPVGRFQMRMNDNHVFILDTATGVAWEKFVTSGSGTTDPQFGASKLQIAK